MVAVLVLDGLELAGDPMNALHRVGVLDGAQILGEAIGLAGEKDDAVVDRAPR